MEKTKIKNIKKVTVIAMLGFTTGILTAMVPVSNWLGPSNTLSNDLILFQQIVLSIVVFISGFVTAFISLKYFYSNL